MDIPELIKTYRLKLKETQEQFGKRFGVYGSTVSQWEKGLREAPYIVLRLVLDLDNWQKCEKCEGTGYIINRMESEKGGEMNNKEICICAAVKSKDGKIIRGHRHIDCFHSMIVRKIETDKRVEGFITSHNRFVDRKEGRKLQDTAGIPSVSRGGYTADDLYSEDLY